MKTLKKQIDKILDYFGYVDKDIVNFSKTFNPSVVIQTDRVIKLVSEGIIPQYDQLHPFLVDPEVVKKIILREIATKMIDDIIRTSEIKQNTRPDGSSVATLQIMIINQNN